MKLIKHNNKWFGFFFLGTSAFQSQRENLYIVLFLLLIPSMNASAESLWKSRELLFDSQYDDLEASFLKADQAVLKSKDGATVYYDFVYQSLFKASDLEENSPVLEKLHEWQSQDPDSYAPLTALSFYHHEYGSFLRGSKFRNETTEEQFSGMRREYEKSKSYALKAITLNKSAIRAYETMIAIEPGQPKHGSSAQQEEGVLLQILCSKNYPLISKKIGCEFSENTFTELPLFKSADEGVLKVRLLWMAYLLKNRPRWGGSYERMQSILDASKSYLTKNEIYYLGAIEVADRMDILQKSKRYQDAIDLGKNYLSIGEKNGFPFYRHDSSVYVELMESSKFLGLHGDCILFGLSASKIYSWNSRTWADIGYCATHEREWGLANFTLRYHADIRSKADAWALFYLGESFRNLREFDKTYTLFSRARREDKSYSEFTDNALKWIEKNHPTKAVELDNSISEIVGPLAVDNLLIELSNKY